MRINIRAILYVAVISSVLSQITTVGSSFRIVMYLAWFLLLIIGVYINHFRLVLSKFSKVFMMTYFTWTIVCIASSLFGVDHLQGNYIRIMLVPLMITLVADLLNQLTNADVMKMCKVYVLCSVVFAIWVNVNYFTSYSSWISSSIYSYAQKNSAAQIWVSAVLICFFLIEKNTIKEKIFWDGCAAYLIVISALSQCRTAILALGIALFVYAMAYSKHKVRLLTSAIIIFGIALHVPAVRRFFDQVFFITKYAGTDLNAMSSGRLDSWARAIGVFMENPIIGNGKYYVDCSYILVLAECGLIGFLLIETVWIFRIVSVAENRIMCHKKKACLGMMIVFYLVESMLEGFPPFGPGVSSFMFWFLCSALSKNLQLENDHLSNQEGLSNE